MADVRLRDVPESKLWSALAMAEGFAKQYPDHVGQRQCVVYGAGSGPLSAFAVHRTPAGQIVVRGIHPVRETEMG